MMLGQRGAHGGCLRLVLWLIDPGLLNHPNGDKARTISELWDLVDEVLAGRPPRGGLDTAASIANARQALDTARREAM